MNERTKSINQSKSKESFLKKELCTTVDITSVMDAHFEEGEREVGRRK